MKVGGYMCHIISNAKDQLKHVFPYINYKKEKVPFQQVCTEFAQLFLRKQSQNTLLSLPYITVIITTFL